MSLRADPHGLPRAPLRTARTALSRQPMARQCRSSHLGKPDTGAPRLSRPPHRPGSGPVVPERRGRAFSGRRRDHSDAIGHDSHRREAGDTPEVRPASTMHAAMPLLSPDEITSTSFGTSDPRMRSRGTRRARSILGRQSYVAKKTTVTLVDDLDGSQAEEQVMFAVDGRTYEIDLSAANGARLRDALAPYISAARRTGGRRGSGSATAGVPPEHRPRAEPGHSGMGRAAGDEDLRARSDPVQRAGRLSPESLRRTRGVVAPVAGDRRVCGRPLDRVHPQGTRRPGCRAPLRFCLPGSVAEPASGAAQLDRAAPEVRSDPCTNDSTPRSHPHYGTCSGCHQLKHVTADGLVRDHNRYRVTGTVVVAAALQRFRIALPGAHRARRAERLSPGLDAGTAQAGRAAAAPGSASRCGPGRPARPAAPSRRRAGGRRSAARPAARPR